jgi:SAM-dependent methyltransferase
LISSTPSKNYNKRFAPSFLEHDWYVLLSLRNCLIELVNSYALTSDARVIADMGCGDSPYKMMFRSEDCRYISCDIAGTVDVLLEPGQPVNLPADSADGIVSIQVLEHVWDLDWYLGECHRILKPGGWLLLSTHGTWPYHAHPTDFRRWTRQGLIGELAQRHFKLECVRGIIGPLAWTTQFRVLGIRQVLGSLPYLGKVILYPLIVFANVQILLEDAITPASIRDDNASIYVTLCRK